MLYHLCVPDDPIFVVQKLHVECDALVAATLVLVPGVVGDGGYIKTVLDNCDRLARRWHNTAKSCNKSACSDNTEFD